MNLYKVNTSVNNEIYYVLAETMNDAETKIKDHLSNTYSSLIKVTHLECMATAKNEATDKAFIYQFKLVI